MARLTYHGHSTFSLETDDGTKLVIDPFFDDNPACSVSASDVEADFILLTHGHYDHCSDAIPIAKRTGATVIASHEVGLYLQSHGLTVSPHGVGGGVTYPFGYVKLTPALHGSKLELPGGEAFSTVPSGLLINLNSGKRVYHAGDTALLMEMQLLADKVDIAILPIGDRYTMGPDDAATAVGFIRPKVVIPCHYDTWPPIAQDAEAFRSTVGDAAQVEIMPPGGTYDF